MSPGAITSASRGGFYSGRALTTPRSYNRAYTAPHGRTYPGQHGLRQKFAVSADDNGGHSVTLADNEVARLTTDDVGNFTIEISNRGEDEGNGDNGGGGDGSSANPVGAVSVTNNARRSFTGQRNRMSWERDPASGGVTFVPGADEVLDVDGDAVQAVVTAHPV